MKQKDTETQKNLMTAFLREAGAYLEYTFYAEQAKTEGYEQIYRKFTEFASNEKAHAKIWFKLFHGISNTQENLQDSMDLENYERTVLYAEFSKKAKEEGFDDIAKIFDGVAEIEKQHEQDYKIMRDCIKNKCVFEKKEEVSWQCLNCGHIHYGLSAPLSCPVCSHPQAFFKVLD